MTDTQSVRYSIFIIYREVNECVDHITNINNKNVEVKKIFLNPLGVQYDLYQSHNLLYSTTDQEDPTKTYDGMLTTIDSMFSIITM